MSCSRNLCTQKKGKILEDCAMNFRRVPVRNTHVHHRYPLHYGPIDTAQTSDMCRIKRQSAFEHAQNVQIIMKTRLFLVKLGFTGVYIIFLISALKHRL